MNVWIRAGDGVFMIKWSFDEKYAKGSPGLLLHAAARDYFHRGTDARWLDTCTYKGNDVMTSLFPDRRHIASHFFVLTSRPQRFIDESVMRAFVGLRPLHRRLYERLHPDERFSRRPRNVSTHPSSTTPREPS
jgi:hypothetical protein